MQSNQLPRREPPRAWGRVRRAGPRAPPPARHPVRDACLRPGGPARSARVPGAGGRGSRARAPSPARCAISRHQPGNSDPVPRQAPRHASRGRGAHARSRLQRSAAPRAPTAARGHARPGSPGVRRPRTRPRAVAAPAVPPAAAALPASVPGSDARSPPGAEGAGAASRPRRAGRSGGPGSRACALCGSRSRGAAPCSAKCRRPPRGRPASRPSSPR